MGKEKQPLIHNDGINKSENANILPATISHTQGHDTTATGGFKGKARKYKWWIVGGLAVLVLVAIILALTLKKSDDNGGGGDNPHPDPGPGPVPDNYNPYIVQPGSMVNSEQKITGFLELSQTRL